MAVLGKAASAVSGSLAYRGADAYRNSLQEWFATFLGPVGYEVRDLEITANDHLAFGRSLNRITRTEDER
jgi:ketosteroid isomerase-like protein